MPTPSKLPDVPTLLRLLDTPHPDGSRTTKSDIARMYDVTPQAVTIKLAGVTEKRLWRRDWPWDVQPQHKRRWFYNALSYYQISSKKERVLRDSERATLVKFLTTLEDMGKRDGVEYVVDYDPDSAAGFYLRPRRDTDDPSAVMASGG